MRLDAFGCGRRYHAHAMGRRRTLIEEAAVAAIALTVISALIDAIFWFRRGSAVAGAGARRVRDVRLGLILVVVTSPS